MAVPIGSNRDQHPSPGASILLGLLRLDAGSVAVSRVRELPPQAWDEVLALALRHGVASLLQRALQAGGALAALPEPLRARLEHERRATALDNLRNYGEFRRVARMLRDRNVPVIALKGLHLAELVYRDISLRPMIDLDLLVPRAQRKQAIVALRAEGYGLEEQMLERAFEEGGQADAVKAMLDGKYHVGLAPRRLGTVVEIHWSLADPLHPYSAPIEDIWRDALPARLGDADTCVMSPEFLLLHVCAHLAYNHVFAFSLRALCDIAEIVRAHPALDWTAVAERGRRHGWRTGVAAALRLARDHLGAQVPAEALAAIGGDALDTELLAEALAHLLALAEIPDELRAAPSLLVLAGRRGLGAKITMAWDRLFVPRAELALIYGVPEHSARIPLYYAARLRDLVRTYSASAWAFSVSDPQLAATAARQARLAKWIAAA
jgi:hypothetical protein